MSKVSIIVPIYGVEKYIADCAHSLFRQTLQEIEYIFVDDCTKDSSIDILNSIIKEYPHRTEQITIIKKETNEGLPQARKTGFEKATGEYIIHIDSDDWIEVDMIENMYNKACSDNFDIVWCDYYEDSSNDSKYVNTYFEFTDKVSVFKRLFNLEDNFHSGVWNKLVKKDIYLKNNVFFPKVNQMEDFVLTIQCFFYSEKFAHLDKALYHYRITPNSLCQDPNRITKRIDEEYKNVFISSGFLVDKMGANISILEPELSDWSNSYKLSTMKFSETRDVNKLFELYCSSNKFIFNKSLKIPFYYKLLLFLATKKIIFPFIFLEYLRRFFKF